VWQQINTGTERERPVLKDQLPGLPRFLQGFFNQASLGKWSELRGQSSTIWGLGLTDHQIDNFSKLKLNEAVSHHVV
jgi:hypothetical protein